MILVNSIVLQGKIMIYPYECECGFKTDIIKSVRDIDNSEKCPKCDTIMSRKIAGGNGFLYAEVEDAEYNPGLGCVVKNKKHRAEIAKQRGLVEVGNEDMNKIMKRQDVERERKISTSYDGIHEAAYNLRKIELKR